MSAKVYPLQDRQADAVDPRDTVWLSASAGTGKTQVLSARVLRLLLQAEVEPSQILCLTFTKAGAAEMATRVNDVLASWVRADDTALAHDLRAIGADFGPEDIARARTRFAAVLDCPGGGLRIETIHAFSQWLLSAFPLEAGLVPGTRPMEDRDRELLLRETLSDLLLDAEASGDEALTDALAMLSLRTDQSGIERFLMACADARTAWHGPGAWQPPLLPRVHRLLGLSADHDADAVTALCEDAAFDVASLRQCLAAQQEWGTKTANEFCDVVGAWLASDAEGRLAMLDALRSVVFTQKGDVKSLKSVMKFLPDYAEYAGRVGECLAEVERLRNLGELARWLAPALTLGRAFALRWAEAKTREGLVDFDDQIHEAARLLKRSDMADWIRYKLDRRFDHILIDEAQDTNAAQWDVIDALTEEFFAGEGARGDRSRTLFVVGDYKQAIFRFQGTSPENFEAAKMRVKNRIDAVRENFAQLRGDGQVRPLREYGLGRSYRTAQPVLDFVDAAIKSIGPENLGLKDEPERHVGEERPGQVVLWRAVGVDAGDEGDEPEDEHSWLSRPDRKVAEGIAEQVRTWLRTGYPLAKGGARNAQAGDIMILVRKRKELAGLIVARLHAKGVPVAGVDRLRLGAPLAVRDLMAAIRFAAQPADDLALACLLTSPLVGWSQEDLLAHGYREGKATLWDHLRKATEETPRRAVAMLLDLLQRADFTPPQALLHWMLVGPWQGRKRLVARLGKEANDPIDELLNAALAFSASNVPSLAAFIRWFDAGDGELKREAEQQGGLVRVMTVHGSKGLQAPIVILADAADDPDMSPPRTLELEEPGDAALGFATRALPLPGLRKEEKLGRIAEAQDAAKQAEDEEHWRLLYVAMTRAEEALFVAGALSTRRKELPAKSWYAALEPLFEDDWAENPVWGASKHWGVEAEAQPGMPKGAAQSMLPLVPAWLTRNAGDEPRPPRPLAPSSLGEHEAPDPPRPPGTGIDAARRGVLIHRLLERLPELAPDARGAAAKKWLSRQGKDLSEEVRQEMVGAALTALSDPRFADVFGPDALAEVPVAAVVGGQVVAGTIDRLCLPDGDAPIRIVDFKTARRPPDTLSDVPAAYIRQMAAYACALETIHPGRRIEAALLYTHAPRLFLLPNSLLDPEKARLRGG
ncbi:double-strand break repair helicase AddA [Croceicoccus sediminis]|uniref:double-strand break repair helicase AddA n=1 Tax=Croceicoccus sediminis TaxID=2571150 RepID=UPI001183D21B|nr:double-strand break repair helicase AddA [Croceicoccus sediminis]